MAILSRTMVDYRREWLDLDEQCRINADKGWIILNSGGLLKDNGRLTQRMAGLS